MSAAKNSPNYSQSLTNSNNSNNPLPPPRSGAPTPADETINAEELALLHLLAQGEAAVFWQLWESHRKHLYLVCLRQMGGIQEEAEDALSRVMLKAWDKLPVYATQICNLKAWLVRLAYNLCVDMHREKRRTRGLESLDEVMLSERDPVAGRSASPEETSIQREILICLCRAVVNLPLPLREPFVLRFFHVAAYPEIAEHLALSPANVRKRIQQARVILRGQLHHHLVSRQWMGRPVSHCQGGGLGRALGNSQSEL